MVTKNPEFLDACIAWILRRPWLVIVLSSLVMLAVGAGAGSMAITSDYRVVFSDDNPEVLAFEALENTYSAPNRALIAVAPRDGSVFTREALSAIEELTEAAWQAPYSSRVDSLTNYSHSEALGEDDLLVRPLVEDAGSLADEELARIKTIALDTTELVGRLLATDGRVAGVAITFIISDDTDAAIFEITNHLDALVDEARASHPGIDYYATGDVVMSRAFADATEADLATLAPIVVLIIVVAAALVLRSILATLAVVAVVLYSVGTTMGFAGWMGVVFSAPNAAIPIIVMVIAVADSIHLLTTALASLRRGSDKKAAIAESFRANAHPVFITSLTTAIGFLTLNASDSPPFVILGNYVAFGVMCAFVYSVTFLPALLAVLPLRAPRRAREAQQADHFGRFADFVIARRTVLLWGVVVAVAVLATGVPRIQFSDNPTQYFDDRFEFRRDADFTADNLTSLNQIEYSLEAGRDNGITDPEYLRQVDAFAQWHRDQPEVTYVQSFPDVMKRLNQNMNGDDPAFHRLPETAELAAQYLLLYEFSLPFGSDLNDRIDVAKSATRMIVATSSSWSEELRGLAERGQTWLRINAPDLATDASGISLMFAHMTQRNLESMVSSTLLALVLISFILIAIFRNLRIGLLSLVPNLLPPVISFGLWGYLVGHVGIASSVVLAVVIGIIVDDTVHFLSKYLKARRADESPPDAVRTAFRTAGPALLTTTVVLSAGFLVFCISGFESTWALGLLVATTTSFALVVDFLLLPALLLALDRRQL